MNDLKAGRRGEWRTSRDKGCVRERDGEGEKGSGENRGVLGNLSSVAG